MNTFFSQFKKEAQEIRLSSREREVMRNALEAAMTSGAFVKNPVRAVPSPYLFFSHRSTWSMAFALLLVVVGGSSVYAAEGAVPGEILYPIKVNISEPIRVALATSSEAKAMAYADLAERRLEEAETLTARGTMTGAAKEVLEQRFEEHAQAAEAVIAMIEETDVIAAADISSRFESVVAAHSVVIARLSQGNEDGESRGESSKLAQTLVERGQRLAVALPRPPAQPQVKAMKVSDSAGTEEQSLSQITARVAFAPMPEELGDDSGVRTKLFENASTTLRELEARFINLEKLLDATTSARTKEQISKIRVRLERFEQASVDAEEIQKVFKDSIQLKTFFDAQEKFRGSVLLPAPDAEEDTEQELRKEEGRDAVKFLPIPQNLSL